MNRNCSAALSPLEPFLSGSAFSPLTLSSPFLSCRVSRRGLLKRCSLVIPAAAVTFGMLPSQPQPAFAGVGEGDLPQEARAFRNVVSAKADWAALGKTISNRGNELSAEEWKNVALFLRRIYQVANDDMRSMAGGFSGDSKKASSQIIDSLMKQVKKTDAVVAAKNVEGFLADQAVVAKLLEDYTDLFNDVPDEL
ncbi:unnamed protein product [Chrysoparadoxa australica]